MALSVKQQRRTLASNVARLRKEGALPGPKLGPFAPKGSVAAFIAQQKAARAKLKAARELRAVEVSRYREGARAIAAATRAGRAADRAAREAKKVARANALAAARVAAEAKKKARQAAFEARQAARELRATLPKRGNWIAQERARLRALGILPRLRVYERHPREPIDLRCGLSLLAVQLEPCIPKPIVKLGPGHGRRPKPAFIPYQVNDPCTGESESGFIVRPPGWQDFVKIDPILGTSQEERIRRRREIAERIRRSPVPELVKGISSIMVALDDVQDAAVTLSVAGRLAARVFPKLIPGVGVISTVADVLNLGSLLPCRLPKSVAASCKGPMEGAGKKTQQTYRKRLAEQVRTGQFRMGWGEAFQILQTTANLVDLGIEIGAGIGYGLELISGLVRGADIVLPSWVSEPAADIAKFFETPKEECAPGEVDVGAVLDPCARQQAGFKTIGLLGHLDKAFGAQVGSTDKGIMRASEWVKDSAKEALKAWGFLGGLQDDLTWEEHLSVMYTIHAAQQVASDIVERFEMAPVLNDIYENGMIEAPAVRDQETWDAIKSVGGSPADPRLPVYGSPREMPYREFIGETRESWARSWRGWLGKAPTAEAWWYGSQLLDNIPDLQAWGLEGPEVRFQTAYTREFQAVLNVLEGKLGFPSSFSPGEIQGRVKAMSERLSPPEVTKLPLQELASLSGWSLG